MTPWQALTPAQRDAIVIKAMAANAVQIIKLAELRQAMAARKKKAGTNAKKGKRR